jgi:hypothetical protein
MTPEIRAKKDKCTLVASVDHGKLRVLGVSDEPLVVLEGQILELRASGGQVHGIQKDPPRDTPRSAGPREDSETDFAERGCARTYGSGGIAPTQPDPHEDSDTDFTDGGLRLATRS